MELINQTFELLVILLGVVVPELNSSCFDPRQRVVARTAVLRLHMVRRGRGLLKEEVVVTREDGPCDVEHALEVEGLSSGHVGVHGDEALLEGSLIIGMESVPEKSIALSYSYPTCAEENLALGIELALIVDDVSFVLHALLGILAGEVDKLLS